LLNLLLGIIAFSSTMGAPTAIESIQTSTETFFNTELNEINSELLKEEETTANTFETTETPFDKRFDIDDNSSNAITLQPLQMQIPSTSDVPVSTATQELEVTTDNASMQAYQTYQEILQSQIFRTFFTVLTELQKHQTQQEVQESQLIETSMPYFNPSECKFDDVSTSGDDGKVIVFDENSGSYVYLDRKLLMESEQNESHVSVIQRRIESG
jgi:uncharacterized protein involved in high-affinity Fe2+ transport